MVIEKEHFVLSGSATGHSRVCDSVKKHNYCSIPKEYDSSM